MAQSKATKKFEKNHLKDTIKRRKDVAKVKQRHQIKAKKKARRAEDNGQPAAGADADDDARPSKKQKQEKDQLNNMSVDEFFAGGFEIPKVPKKATKSSESVKRKRANPEAQMEDSSSVELSAEQEVLRDSASDLEDDNDGEGLDAMDAHKSELKALQSKDPEFYKFLKDNDAELLDFAEDANLAEIDELSESDEDDAEKPAKKGDKNARQERGSAGQIRVKLHEPALTEDNLGLKTWSSSFVLASQLHFLDLPGLSFKHTAENQPFILELGSGTGLLGIAAAAIWQKHVVLTDLPEIVPNLAKNIQINADLLGESNASAISRILDWRVPESLDLETSDFRNTKAAIVLVADPIYSPEHPEMLVNTIKAWLQRHESSRVVISYPIREAYGEQIKDLRRLMSDAGLVVIDECMALGQDDWADEVTCSCSIWRWREVT